MYGLDKRLRAYLSTVLDEKVGRAQKTLSTDNIILFIIQQLKCDVNRLKWAALWEAMVVSG